MLADIANYQIESNAVSIIVINDNISPMLQSKLDSRVKRTLGQGFDSKVIYNGIHFDQVATSPHAMGQTCHIVNVGRLQNDKGQKVLVEAAKILKKQGDIDFTIDFIGGGENETSLTVSNPENTPTRTSASTTCMCSLLFSKVSG